MLRQAVFQKGKEKERGEMTQKCIMQQSEKSSTNRLKNNIISSVGLIWIYRKAIFTIIKLNCNKTQ